MPLRTWNKQWRSSASFLLVLTLIGCSSVPRSTEENTPRQVLSSKTSSSQVPALPPAGSGRGGYYMDDGPGSNPPAGLLDIPDPEPQVEPYSKRGNNPYVVFGKNYTPITDERPFKQSGVGSWYGKKFHGQKTSSGEIYDMYKMTAAHPTLPIPSYVRVTNLNNGKQVIVRVNDRGPFHSSRIIDLSYIAALKLGYLDKGSSQLEVERLLPEEIERIAQSKGQQERVPVQAASTMESPDAIEMMLSRGGGGRLSPAATSDKVNTEISSVTLNGQSDVPSMSPSIVAPGTGNAIAPGFYIQWGAYTQSGNAEIARAKVQGMALPIEVVEYGRFYRLQSGPFPTRAEAATAALQLQRTAGLKPLIVQR